MESLEFPQYPSDSRKTPSHRVETEVVAVVATADDEENRTEVGLLTGNGRIRTRSWCPNAGPCTISTKYLWQQWSSWCFSCLDTQESDVLSLHTYNRYHLPTVPETPSFLSLFHLVHLSSLPSFYPYSPDSSVRYGLSHGKCSRRVPSYLSLRWEIEISTWNERMSSP